MKSLLIVRHAKSSWDTALTEDLDRPLNDRGKRDAPDMAERLLKKKIKIDAFISSPARRARKTAEVFAGKFGLKKEDIIIADKLYLPSPDTFFEVIEKVGDNAGSIALFSHNPGVTLFANLLTSVYTDNIPTCGIFAVKAAVNGWKEFKAAPKEFWFYDFPKQVE